MMQARYIFVLILLAVVIIVLANINAQNSAPLSPDETGGGHGQSIGLTPTSGLGM
jgi:hypothetical protein